MKQAMALAALLFLAWTPARAGEVFGGVFTHGARIGITVCCYEGGSDIEIGARSAPVFSLGRLGDFRLYALGSVNTSGGVDSPPRAWLGSWSCGEASICTGA